MSPVRPPVIEGIAVHLIHNGVNYNHSFCMKVSSTCLKHLPYIYPTELTQPKSNVTNQRSTRLEDDLVQCLWNLFSETSNQQTGVLNAVPYSCIKISKILREYALCTNILVSKDARVFKHTHIHKCILKFRFCIMW